MTEATLEQLEDNGFIAVPEILWDNPTPLRPGVDYHDGVTYFTLPARVNVETKVGRGKAAETKVEPQDMLVCVTSDRDKFPYVAERVAEHGFSYPDNVVIEKKRRWSAESIIEFLAGQSTEPNPADLHTGLRNVYETYVEFANEAYYDLMPIFVMGTYMFRLFRTTGYLHFNGTAASGKSQNLRILEALAFNTQWASSMSAAALYRQLAGMPGLICIDEAEGFDGERGEDLRRILNAGYLEGEGVKRAEKGPGDRFVVANFETFGPKAIASINPLDYVIGSRCLIVAMRPSLRTIPEFDRNDVRWPRLRDRLYLWAMYHSERIEALANQWNAETRYARAPSLVSRQWQVTQMHVVLADYIDQFDDGDRCDRLIAFFNQYFADLQRQQDATDRIRIVLKCLPRVLAEHTPDEGGFYPLKTIHQEVIDRLEVDAAEYYKTRSLSKHLDVLGFKNKRSKKGGTQVQLLPERVRDEFRQRRVDPYDEDLAWLSGEVEYDHEPPPTHDASLSVWADMADEETP